jgi:hypothetical protein
MELSWHWKEKDQHQIGVKRIRCLLVMLGKILCCAAKRLYNALTSAGLNPWLDKESLLPSQEWDLEIRKAIKNSAYFLAVTSSNSVDKRGYLQKEFKFGLEVPKSQIFVIPARLNECNFPYEKLPGENWKIAIRTAIKNSRFFIPLFSSRSVDKIGYLQKEFKYAIDIFEVSRKQSLHYSGKA